MEASLAITGRIDIQHAAIPPIVTEAVEVRVGLALSARHLVLFRSGCDHR